MATQVNKTEECRKIVRRLGAEAPTADIRKALKTQGIEIDDTIIRQCKREVGQEPKSNGHTPTAKPKKQPVDGKEALFKMFDEQGVDIDYASVYRQLNGMGLQIGTEWFDRLKLEYLAKHPEIKPMATATQQEVPPHALNGTTDKKHDEPTPVRPSPTEMVRAARNLIALVGSKEEALSLINEL